MCLHGVPNAQKLMMYIHVQQCAFENLPPCLAHPGHTTKQIFKPCKIQSTSFCDIWDVLRVRCRGSMSVLASGGHYGNGH